MINQKTVTINGDDYLITQFGARQGWKLGKKVAKIMLPVMSKVYSDDEAEGGFGAMMETIAAHLDEIDDKTVDELLSQVTVNKYPLDFDKQFAGNYDGLLLLLWEVIEFNFSSIFTMATEDTND